MPSRRDDHDTPRAELRKRLRSAIHNKNSERTGQTNVSAAAKAESLILGGDDPQMMNVLQEVLKRAPARNVKERRVSPSPPEDSSDDEEEGMPPCADEQRSSELDVHKKK